MKPTIYQALKERLGREPTDLELKAEVSRILDEALVERKKKGGRKPKERRLG